MQGALEVIGAIGIAVWLYLLLGRGGFWREFLGNAVRSVPAAWPSVAAVIPARNEEETIAAAVGSLAKQLYRGPMRIVVVDDHSGDRTADRAQGAEVVHAGPLPPGWTGKMWAVAQGIEHTASFAPDYFLLTDADIVHAPENLASLVARARAGDYALVSYMATLRCRTHAERALVPAFVFFFFMLYPPQWVRDPRRGTAGAAGGCMLVRRDALEKIGGIQAIRGEWIDDCALAGAVKRSVGRVWLGLDRGTQSLRNYRTFGEVGEMIARTAYTQLRYSPLLLAGTIIGMTAIYFAPPALALAAPQPARGFGALAWLLMSIAYVPAVRYYRRSPLWAPFLPLIALFYTGCTLYSAARHWTGRGGLWKGRTQSQ